MLFIYLISFLLFYKINDVSSKPALKMVVYFYILASVCSLVLWYCYPDLSRDYPLRFGAIVYHIFVMTIMMMPLTKYDSKFDVTRIDIQYNTLKIYLYILIVLALISIASSFVTYSLILSSGISIVDGRNSAFGGESFMRIVKPYGSFLSHVSTISSEFSYITLFLAFLLKCSYPEKKFLFRMTLFSSLSAIFFQLEWFGRENIVRFIFDFLIIYYLFSNRLLEETKKKIKKTAIVVSAVISVPFIAITLSRFDTSISDGGPGYSILSYLGQGMIHFSPFYHAYSGNMENWGHTTFAVFYPESMRGSIFNAREQVGGSIDVPFNTFGTYVASIVNDWGALGAFIPLALLFAFSRYVGRMRSDDIFFYIYALWVLRFFASGIFYWIDLINNLDRIACFILVIGLHILSKSKYN